MPSQPHAPLRQSSLPKSVSFNDHIQLIDDDYDEPIVPIPPARYSSLVTRRRKQVRLDANSQPGSSLFTTVKEQIKNFELKKFAKRANLNLAKMQKSWTGFDKEMAKQQRDTINERYTKAQLSGQEKKWAKYRFETAPKSVTKEEPAKHWTEALVSPFKNEVKHLTPTEEIRLMTNKMSGNTRALGQKMRYLSRNKPDFHNEIRFKYGQYLK